MVNKVDYTKNILIMIVKNNWCKFLLLLAPIIVIGVSSCQKMSRPVLGDYPKDVPVTPTTELRFYVPFDSTSPEDKQINIRFKDSISKYPSFFPDKSIGVAEGVHGTAVQ